MVRQVPSGALTVTVKVEDLPDFKALYRAVHVYLVEMVKAQGGKTLGLHQAYCDLIDTHDAIARRL